MKQLLTLTLLFCCISCQNIIQQPTKQATPANTKIVILMDNSKSFINRYTKADTVLLKQLVEKIRTSASVSIHVGLITHDSDVEFIRYSTPIKETANNNPWISTGETSRTTKDEWTVFANAYQKMCTAPPASQSDIGGGIAHSLLILNESKLQSRKILIVASDFKNNGKPYPIVDNDIEVFTIGSVNAPISKLLKTDNIRSFESFPSCFQTIIDEISVPTKNDMPMTH